MAEFNRKERFVASLLSSMPGIKKEVKKIYVLICYLIYKKNYRIRYLDPRVRDKFNIAAKEFDTYDNFFGYYDKTCEWDNKVIGHCSKNLKSKLLPSPKIPIELFIKDLNSNFCKTFATSSSYNWQQGTRLHWLDSSQIIFNYYDEKERKYKAAVYSTTDDKITRNYDYPVQESYKSSFYLSINYSRLWNMRPDYCYRNLPKLTQAELNNMKDDGIFYVDLNTGNSKLLHSLTQIINTNYKPIFNKCNHNANHVMCSPDGKHFIFIHRNYLGKRRFDRLMLSDFEKLKVLIDEGYVSHCCWLDNETILGYLKYNGKNGFYFCNINTGKIQLCNEMSNLNTGDGHPSFNGRFIAFDTYPDKSRMQKLFLYDCKYRKIIPLIELFQSIRYKNETRCDLHPRFSHDGKKVYFDTVYNGYRQLCYIDISFLSD